MLEGPILLASRGVAKLTGSETVVAVPPNLRQAPDIGILLVSSRVNEGGESNEQQPGAHLPGARLARPLTEEGTRTVKAITSFGSINATSMEPTS